MKTPATRVRGIMGVRAEASSLPGQIAEINKAFAAHKDNVEQAIAELKAGRTDVLTAEKGERIEADLTALTASIDELKAQNAALRIGGGGSEPVRAEVQAHQSAFNQWFRKGTEPDAGMRELEVKASLTTMSDPDGGFLVPEQTDATIRRVLGTVSALRGLARVVSVSSDQYKTLVSQAGTASGWVGEKASRPETATPTLAEIAVNMGELYANPAATQRALDDAAFNVEQWLADEISIEFAEKEGAAFISGNGVEKPRGILSYDKVANASYAWGKTGFVVGGAASDFLTPTTTASPADALVNLFYALKAGYRNNGTFLTSDATLGKIRQFKDGNGQWLWQPPTTEAPGTILGKPVVTDDNMPAVEANAFVMAFADFQRAYLVADRIGTRVLRDPYTNKPYVHFYATKRVGGAVVNFEAIKLLKIST